MIALLLACHDDPPATPGPHDSGTVPADEVHDPLSMPASPTLDPADFASAEACAACHPDHAAEWRSSMHAYAMVDPVFQALVAVRQADYDGAQDQFCLQCHSAIATRGGEIVRGFSFGDLSPIAMEGITCTSCHYVTEVERDYNSGHRIEPDGPIQGPIADPIATDAHESEGNAVFEGSLFCGGCHDVIENDGLDLERPYREWTQSPSAAAGEQCQACHMREIERPAAVDGPTRTTHEHRWVGVDVPLVDGWMSAEDEEALRQGTRDLLATAAELELAVPEGRVEGGPLNVTVTVHNRIDGHNLPTGSTFLRQVWVGLVATDSAGNTLFTTGQLDANGDLEDYWSELAPFGDPNLISLSSGFVDGAGARTVFPWVADELTSGAIPPGYERTYTLFVPTDAAAPGPITIEAHLYFRALPPFLMRLLGFGDAVERIELHDIASDALVVE